MTIVSICILIQLFITHMGIMHFKYITLYEHVSQHCPSKIVLQFYQLVPSIAQYIGSNQVTLVVAMTIEDVIYIR